MTESLIPNYYRFTSAQNFVNTFSFAGSNADSDYYYVFAGNHLDYENSTITPIYDDSHDTSYDVYRNMIFGKIVTNTDVALVIKRIEWQTSVVYAIYDDRDTTLSQKNFFVYAKEGTYYHVYKCLGNNSGGVSTVKPSFSEIGTDGIQYSPTDGYTWKYMYTIDTGSKVKFMDKTWIPVTVSANTPSPLINTAGAGSIDVINVTGGGSGYDPANAVITVAITGDGTGAAGTANVVSGVIKDIIVTNPGSNYTYANVSIISSLGSGATAESPTSPVGGHGFDPISELGCSHVMFTSEFNGSEGGLIPTDIDFHQLGLVVNPSSLASQTAAAALGINSTIPANNSIYKTTTDLIVAPGFGTYVQDEVVFQGPDDNILNATFTAIVLSFDTSTNVLKLINTTGTPSNNSPIFGQSSSTTRTLLSYNTPNFVVNSGYLIYVENRAGVQRSSDGIEQFKIIIGF